MRVLLGLFFVGVIVTSALADGMIQSQGVGRVNRNHTGAQARLMAERAAQVDAARQLLAKTDARSTSKVPGTHRIVTYGTLRGHRYQRVRFLPDGSARVLAEIPIYSPHSRP